MTGLKIPTFKKLISLLTLAWFGFVVPLLARAKYGLEEAATGAGLTLDINTDTLPGKIGQILSVVLGFMGVLFLVIVIYGGFLWMTAGGGSEQVKKAGTMIKNGTIGIVIILLSYALVLFIFNTVIGV